MRMLGRTVAAVAFVASSLTIVALLVLGVAGVVARNAGLALAGTEQLARLAFIWATFLAVITVSARDDHLAVTYFRARLPTRAGELVEGVLKIAIAIGLGWVVIWGATLLPDTWPSHNPPLGIPQTFVYLPVWLGLAGAAAFELVQGVRRLSGRSARVELPSALDPDRLRAPDEHDRRDDEDR